MLLSPVWLELPVGGEGGGGVLTVRGKEGELGGRRLEHRGTETSLWNNQQENVT